MTSTRGFHGLRALYKRELSGYFNTPLALVFMIIFVALSGALTFYLGNFYDRRQADLLPFFQFHPWLYLFLLPALAMRLWAEERRSGTLELLMTLGIPSYQLVLGKFLAAWTFAGLALVLTFPLWVTVNYLGDPDNAAIVTSYLGSWLMAGAYLAISQCLSVLTRSQVIAFILAVAVCFVLTLSGFPMVLDAFQSWAPGALVDAVASLSLMTHFEGLSRGVITFSDVWFFAVTMAVWLLANRCLLDMKKA
ncbi:ABC transporter permease [Terasakiispira papahanaumokuakeensis]|uniref:ABC transporter permease n=1 Tax=Terasakiispira papahanaumokuakeensis TaxID=197479 RepID=A0A1E2V7A7_9GAMM|nr:ABC transporter permease subunit [Terasakiispira papahanaumokuakeensis]ODC02898.1 ABC transporter permease [Terasakiispira papahanaumokuakeensis]